MPSNIKMFSTEKNRKSSGVFDSMYVIVKGQLFNHNDSREATLLNMTFNYIELP